MIKIEKGKTEQKYDGFIVFQKISAIFIVRGVIALYLHTLTNSKLRQKEDNYVIYIPQYKMEKVIDTLKAEKYNYIIKTYKKIIEIFDSGQSFNADDYSKKEECNAFS